MWTVLLITILAKANAVFLADFSWDALVEGDDVMKPRPLLLDLAGPDTLLVNGNEDTGERYTYTYNPKKHSSYNSESGTFTRSFDALHAENSSSVSGKMASDFLKALPLGKKVRVKFGLVDKINGQSPFTTPRGARVAGRFGLSRKQSTSPSLKDGLFEGYNDVLCLAARCSSYYCEALINIDETVDRLGGFLLTTTATNNKQGLWEFEASGWSMGSAKSSRPLNFELSTTVEDLVVPERDFQVMAFVMYSDERRVVDCRVLRTLPDLVIKVGNESLAIKPTDYVEQKDSECRMRIRPGDGLKGKWVLGTSFLHSNGVCLDYSTGAAKFYLIKPIPA